MAVRHSAGLEPRRAAGWRVIACAAHAWVGALAGTGPSHHALHVVEEVDQPEAEHTLQLFKTRDPGHGGLALRGVFVPHGAELLKVRSPASYTTPSPASLQQNVPHAATAFAPAVTVRRVATDPSASDATHTRR